MACSSELANYKHPLSHSPSKCVCEPTGAMELARARVSVWFVLGYCRHMAVQHGGLGRGPVRSVVIKG